MLTQHLEMITMEIAKCRPFDSMTMHEPHSYTIDEFDFMWQSWDVYCQPKNPDQHISKQV